MEDQLETIYKRDYLSDKWPNIKLYLSVHSYLDAIYVPPGILAKQPSNAEDLMIMAKRMARAIGRSRVLEGPYKGFEVRPKVVTASDLGQTSGTADDWALKMGAEFAFTIELPPKEKMPTESTPFSLPRFLILPVCAKYIKVSLYSNYLN